MTGLPQTAPLGALGVSVSSGTVAARDKHGAFTLFGSTGPIGRTADGKYRGEAVLVARVGANAGHVYRVHGQYGVTDNTLIVSPGNGLSARYLEQFLLHQDLNRLVYGSGQPLITGRTLKELDVPVLNEPEREMVATALGDVDEFIETIESLIAKKRAVKQGMMQELLTGRTRLPGFDGEWAPLNVAKASHVKARIGWQGLTTSEYRASGEYRLVGGTEFQNGRVRWSATPYVDRWRFDQDRNIQLRIGDVLITKDGTIGKVAFVESLPGPATLNSGVFVVRPKPGTYDSGFLFHMLKSSFFDEFVTGLSAGSTINHLYQRDLEKLELAIPESRAEQRAISGMLRAADAEIAALERRLESARAIKQGMMQELLTGRTRLPVKEDGE